LFALASAKEQATRIQGVNKQKQLGLASHTHTADNNDKMAYPNRSPPWTDCDGTDNWYEKW